MLQNKINLLNGRIEDMKEVMESKKSELDDFEMKQKVILNDIKSKDKANSTLQITIKDLTKKLEAKDKIMLTRFKEFEAKKEEWRKLQRKCDKLIIEKN